MGGRACECPSTCMNAPKIDSFHYLIGAFSGYRFALIEMSASSRSLCKFPFMLTVVLSEVILSTLLRNFKFQPSGHHVVWNLSQILSPSVKVDNDDGNVKEVQGLPVEIGLLK